MLKRFAKANANPSWLNTDDSHWVLQEKKQATKKNLSGRKESVNAKKVRLAPVQGLIDSLNAYLCNRPPIQSSDSRTS
jgi:hypothetical protein